MAVCRLSLVVPGSRSLKAKRSALRRIKDRTLSKLRVAVAEVDTQEAHNHAVVGFAVVSGDGSYADELADRVVAFIEDLGVAEIVDHERDSMQFGDAEFPDNFWTREKFE